MPKKISLQLQQKNVVEPTRNTNKQDTKHFQNVLLVGMASEISKNYTHTSVDCLRHNGIKGARLNVHNNQILEHTFSHGTLHSVVF